MQTVLVTGAFGLVGRETVARLTRQGRSVVATDLDTAANRKAARKLPSSVRVAWADLTDEAQVEQLVEDAAPSAIVHLAAVIPAMSYTNVALAQRVNVGATRVAGASRRGAAGASEIRAGLECCRARCAEPAPWRRYFARIHLRCRWTRTAN